MIILFTADWCPPCNKMKAETFKDKEVIKLSKQFIFFKVDLTSEGNKEAINVAESYKVSGIPTLIFYGKDGKKSKESFSGYIDAKEFISRMNKVLNTDSNKKK